MVSCCVRYFLLQNFLQICLIYSGCCNGCLCNIYASVFSTLLNIGYKCSLFDQQAINSFYIDFSNMQQCAASAAAIIFFFHFKSCSYAKFYAILLLKSRLGQYAAIRKLCCIHTVKWRPLLIHPQLQNLCPKNPSYIIFLICCIFIWYAANMKQCAASAAAILFTVFFGSLNFKLNPH